MRRKKIVTLLMLLASFALSADHCTGSCSDTKTCGKVDISAVYAHIDLLDHHDTVDRMDIPAIRGDACWAFWKGFCLRPTVMWGDNDRELFATGIGFGHITPLTEKWTVTPLIGFNYMYLTTTTSIPLLGLDDLDQTFYTYAPYAGVEVCWSFAKRWRIYGQFNYAWTRNRTTIDTPFGTIKVKERSTGPSWTALLEYDLTPKWSVNLGGAYNTSSSHEKRGMRAYGVKLGLARWF